MTGSPPRTKIILEPVDHGPGSPPRTKIDNLVGSKSRSVTRKAPELPVIMESQASLQDLSSEQTKIMTETGYTESRPTKGGFGHGH